MARNRSKRLPPNPGWAMYLRTSNKEAQNPKMSQERQRFNIQRALLERSELSLISEYADVESGTKADRSGYQQMLYNARIGKFSHVAVENAERFGRNDAEALSVIDELHKLGVAIRFADYPDLDPIDPDDRILVSLSFTLARRESIKLGERVKGGLHTKLRNGGFVGRAPDGYINMETRTDSENKAQNGKYTRWIEPDPERFKIWRLAWDLLLSDKLTLAEICEELHKRGYRLRSGRPFVEITVTGIRRTPKGALSRIFRNWFYAGWVASEKANIPPKTIRGTWKPLLTTEEFERGLEILARRNVHRIARRKHDYLLKGMIYVELPVKNKTVKLTGSTSNSSRSGGGTAYYCIPSSNINILCSKVDGQIAKHLHCIQINPELIPAIRECYSSDIVKKLGHMKPTERAEMQAALVEVDQEEARAARLYVSGKITESVWDMLWREWQDRRNSIRANLEASKYKRDIHIAHLDDALDIIAEVSILYNKLERSDRKKLLRHIVEQVIARLLCFGHSKAM